MFSYHQGVHGTPLLYSSLENPMDGGAWQAAVHGVAKSRTRLSDFTFTFHFHALEKGMATHPSVSAWRIPGMGRLVGCRLWGCTESDTTEVTQQQQQQQGVHTFILVSFDCGEYVCLLCNLFSAVFCCYSFFFPKYHLTKKEEKLREYYIVFLRFCNNTDDMMSHHSNDRFGEGETKLLKYAVRTRQLLITEMSKCD